MTLAELAAQWRARADELRAYSPPAAEAFVRAAAELDAALRAAADEPLTLAEAARASGYSRDRLRHMIADGVVRNAGRRGAPRIRRADLPRKRRSSSDGSSFDAATAAAQVLGR